MSLQPPNLNHSADATASPSALQPRFTCRFDGIRSAHRVERTEDYCEAVAELSRRTREARVRDRSAVMGVPPESAEADAEGIEHHVSRHGIDEMLRRTRALNEPVGSPRKAVAAHERPGPEAAADARPAKPARKVRR